MAGRGNHEPGTGPKPQGVLRTRPVGVKKGPDSPSIPFSEEKFAEILEHLACGEGLKPLCELEGFPAAKNFWKWMVKRPELRPRYLEAKKMGILALVEDSQAIVDDGRNDWMERLAFNGSHPTWELNGEHIQRSRERVQNIRWLATKLLPEFAEKQEVKHTVNFDKLAEGRKRVADAKRNSGNS